MLLRGFRRAAPNLYSKFIFPKFGREFDCKVSRNFSSVIKNVPVVTFHSKCSQPWKFSANLLVRSYHDDSSKESAISNVKLMEFQKIQWPNLFKYFKNIFMVILIKQFDSQFLPQTFLEGAEQAVSAVSSSISSGDFDSLNGLVTEEAIKEIKGNYEKMSPEQKNYIAVNSKDFYIRMIYEIGMIFENGRRFVEITTIMQGFHGIEHSKEKPMEELIKTMKESPEQLYICNYRFIREYTKGVEDSWIINKLNHWNPVT